CYARADGAARGPLRGATAPAAPPRVRGSGRAGRCECASATSTASPRAAARASMTPSSPSWPSAWRCSVDAWSQCKENKWGLTPFIFLLAFPAAAAYDLNEVRLGVSEQQVKSRFPRANCQPLEWKTRAADRRCDDSRVKVGEME